MADHRATWARFREVVRQRYPNDDLEAEIAARKLFDAEETAAYAADLDDARRHATQGRAPREAAAEGSDAGGSEEEYVHLDDDDLDADDLAYLELPTDEEAAESAAEQRALMASFETKRRDESCRRLMAAELAASQQSMHQSAYRRNLVAETESRAAAGWWLHEERARAAAGRWLQKERARTAELVRARKH
jgi:hypothetical protein